MFNHRAVSWFIASLVGLTVLVAGAMETSAVVICQKGTGKKAKFKLRESQCKKREVLVRDLAASVGPGEQGPAGPRGEQGPAGPRGELGLAGSPGGFDPAPFGTGVSGSYSVAASEDWTDAGGDHPGVVLEFTDFTVGAGQTLAVPSGTTLLSTGTFRNDGTIIVDSAQLETPNDEYAPSQAMVARPGSSGGTLESGCYRVKLEFGEDVSGYATTDQANNDCNAAFDGQAGYILHTEYPEPGRLFLR